MIHRMICLILFNTAVLSAGAQTWDTVGDRLENSGHPYVYTIDRIENILYVGGAFKYAGNKLVMNIATWNGYEWDSLGSGIPQLTFGVKTVEKYGNAILVGGGFHIPYLQFGDNFAKWDGMQWNDIGGGLSGNEVKALAFNGLLYLGGSIFSFAGQTPYNQDIAAWDGSNYQSLDGGINGSFSHVEAMTVFNDELIVAGVFSHAGNITAFNIAAWDGNNWRAMDTGVDGTVTSLVVDTVNNFLYAGGGFYSAGGIGGVPTYSGIARWDGYEWDSLGNDIYPWPIAMEFYRHDLYVGSGFDDVSSSGDSLYCIARWDGKKWQQVFPFPNNSIYDLKTYGDDLYVGGGFTMIGNDSIAGIARWHMPPDTGCDYLQAIIQPRNGTIGIIDDTNTVHFYNNIIHADSWYWDFGDGSTDTVQKPVHTYTAQGIYDVSVIVSYQGCLDTARTTITVYDDTGIGDNENATPEYLGDNIPNPFNNTTIIPYFLPEGSKGFMQITDMRGELLDEYSLQPGWNRLEVSMKTFSSGVYLYSIIIDGSAMGTKRMVVGKE